MNFNRSDFPEGFTFGAATSAYQIEGHATGGAGSTHWDTFAATPGNVVRQENGDLACDHYNRFEEDLDLMRAAGFDAYRFSTSWARVMPDGRTPNPEGLDFYDRLVDAMLERGLDPYVTLYHWELPSPLADMGGWRSADMPHWFGDYTACIMGRIGDRVATAAPINEPWCVGWLSHFLGHHAPGLRDIRATARAMHHVLKSHGTAIQVMRGLGVKNLGGVFNFEWAHPVDDSAEARKAADLYDGYYNRFFLDGIYKGRYPDSVMEGFAPHLPDGWQDDFDLIGQPLDWVGLNYYTRKIVKPTDDAWPSHAEAPTRLPLTQMGWEIYPDGLYNFLTRTAQDYTGDTPLFITENGMANADVIKDGVVDDPERIAYVSAHLDAVKRAIADGAPVSGYFLWSLLDNYEWALGYEKRFGLIHMDFDTLKRTPKASYYALKDALAR
ncbi:GH1 family beta-glucosidase [Pseudooctadecabacter jejudonensis]|uniref:Beta-glucosidase n=1 Tax=Pseudooctadecabacter jejudonensis TaxID=1391910 RepID=A0A1Y5RF85_9RHOB|nr:GH1 family beta-glucosidase [Pseudooctadecabacter jejudonensis]SLN14830.1 Beta-glucosidase A [Pseudooctadecabacter jejudonensis]